MIHEYFRLLGERVRQEGGALIKTVGEELIVRSARPWLQSAWHSIYLDFFKRVRKVEVCESASASIEDPRGDNAERSPGLLWQHHQPGGAPVRARERWGDCFELRGDGRSPGGSPPARSPNHNRDHGDGSWRPSHGISSSFALRRSTFRVVKPARFPRPEPTPPARGRLSPSLRGTSIPAGNAGCARRSKGWASAAPSPSAASRPCRRGRWFAAASTPARCIASSASVKRAAPRSDRPPCCGTAASRPPRSWPRDTRASGRRRPPKQFGLVGQARQSRSRGAGCEIHLGHAALDRVRVQEALAVAVVSGDRVIAAAGSSNSPGERMALTIRPLAMRDGC